MTTAAAMNITREEAAARAAALTVDAYEVSLDLTRGAEHFHTATTVTFAATQDAVGTHTWIDFVAEQAPTVTLNGEALDVADFDGARLRIGPLAAQNTLVVDGLGDYSNTGEGLHRFVDPVDQEVYLYTQFEVPDSRRMFAVFEQPDLKAAFRFTVTAPAHWAVVSNQPEASRRTLGVVANEENPQGVDAAVWEFKPTPRIPSYITALVAGPYASVHSELTSADGRTIPLGVYCRASLVEHLDAENVFELTRQGFEFFEAQYGHAYPFEKYDQLFVPEFNAGAMENAGCVTFLESYVFRGTVPEALIERRAITILHELAHMWFGDLVTMQWWDDLWLNESFATWSAATAQTAIGEYADAWTTFASVEKAWAYQQDQLPSTHPIAADAPDIETAEQNFDGITYAKGASVLKQLQAYVGYEEFFAGVRKHFDNHAYANATFADLLGALEEASGRDLSGWAGQWLRTTGVSVLRPEIGETFAVLQEEPRPHRVRVGLYALEGDAVRRIKQVETDIDGERTEIPELAGIEHDLAIVNDDDLTYAKMRLTPEHQRFALKHIGEIEDSLARTVIWSSLWESVRDGELPAREFVRLVAREASRETHPSVQERLLAQATQAVRQYVDPAWEGEGMDLLNTAFRGAEPAAIFDRALARLTPTEETISYFKELLERSDNQEVRWLALTSLIAAGALPLSAADEEQDNTSEGTISRLRAKAVVDKRWAWDTLVEDDLTNLEARYLMDGLTFTYDGLEGLTDEYFRQAPALWERLTNEMAQRTLEGMYPRWDVTTAAVDKANELLLSDDAPSGLKRVIAEGQDRIARAVRNREVDATSA